MGVALFPGEDVGAGLFEFGEIEGDVDGSVGFGEDFGGFGFDFLAFEGVELEVGFVVGGDFGESGGGEEAVELWRRGRFFEGFCLLVFVEELDEDVSVGLGVAFDGGEGGGLGGAARVRLRRGWEESEIMWGSNGFWVRSCLGDFSWVGKCSPQRGGEWMLDFSEFGEHFTEDGGDVEVGEDFGVGVGGAEHFDGGAGGTPLGVVVGAEEGDDGDAHGGGEVGDAGVVAEVETGAAEPFGEFVKAHVQIPREIGFEGIDDGVAPAFLFGFAEGEGGEDVPLRLRSLGELEEVFAGPAFGVAAGAGVDDDGARRG